MPVAALEATPPAGWVGCSMNAAIICDWRAGRAGRGVASGPPRTAVILAVEGAGIGPLGVAKTCSEEAEIWVDAASTAVVTTRAAGPPVIFAAEPVVASRPARILSATGTRSPTVSAAPTPRAGLAVRVRFATAVWGIGWSPACGPDRHCQVPRPTSSSNTSAASGQRRRARRRTGAATAGGSCARMLAHSGAGGSWP